VPVTTEIQTIAVKDRNTCLIIEILVTVDEDGIHGVLC
jgi:hypothetical protein